MTTAPPTQAATTTMAMMVFRVRCPLLPLAAPLVLAEFVAEEAASWAVGVATTVEISMEVPEVEVEREVD